MKTKLFLITAIIGSLVFTGCKDDDPATPEVVIPKLKTATYYDGTEVTPSYSEAYEYNASGQIVKIVAEDNSYVTVEYSTGKITLKFVDELGVQDPNIEEFILNDKGLYVSSASTWKKSLKSSIKKNYKSQLKSQLSILGSSSTTLTYNADNYLIEENSTEIDGLNNSSDITTYTITSGNTTGREYVSTYNDVSTTSNDTFEFFTDKTNTIGYENMGVTFFGKQDNNLQKKRTQTGESYSYISNYSYEYDSYGRVTKQIEKDEANTIIYGQTTYTYTD